MTNRERYDELLKTGKCTSAAKEALYYASACGSRASSWNWAERSLEALSSTPKAQAALRTALGSASFPDTKAGLDLIEDLLRNQVARKKQ
jgi:hypothetical protein